MSSGSSGRYQSRLLNFVHLQSRRLTQQWDHTLRNLQVATQWGVELLLYPIYLLLNPTTSAPKTLGSQEPPPRLNLEPETPSSVDTPIEKVLAAVKSLPSESKSPPLTWWGFVSSKLWGHLPNQPTKFTNSQNSPENIQPYLPVVRGIATSLVNRNLVLVTADNEILDVLTPQQQAKLAARIISEVGNYWHDWRLTANQPQSKLLGKVNQILAQLTSRIRVNIPALPHSTPTTSLNTDKLIAFLDTSIAKWETNALLPVRQGSQEIIQVAQNQLDICFNIFYIFSNIFIYGREQVATRENVAVNGDSLANLIAAAINYFFGGGKNPKIAQNPSQMKLQHRFSLETANKQLQNQDLDKDSWVNWNDLFGNSPKYRGYLTQWPNNSCQNLNSQAITENHPDSQVDYQPDWIEVEATFIGYDKHPLEQILEWLDLAILWLEEIIVKIVQFFQRLWSSKLKRNQ
ncbi:hypothetical protein NWP17_10365 [Chrysosporum bergii ANA360D]|uniref:Uncharacterized protein n=1 Tax=Chrysosporum bergii ANA360D TaxID=617107 RepID=A0AA43KBV9_9CYAN|nr:hypothetical protein [Chrysosporum bergii]MDH6060837.1 hypothetical protein [Chrysosporum bergii ANA360D]